jgi:hypothetical protein
LSWLMSPPTRHRRIAHARDRQDDRSRHVADLYVIFLHLL